MNFIVSSHKGGVGKSVTAVHIAGCLTEMYGRGMVGLVDLDRNRSSLTWGAEGKLPFVVVDDEEKLGNEEIAVYDSPGRMDQGSLQTASRGSEMMVLATTPRQGSTEPLLLLLEDLREAGAVENFRVLITMVPWWNPRHAKSLKYDCQQEGIPVFDTWIPQREAVEDAWREGILVSGVRRKNARDVWKAYRSVTEEMMEIVLGGQGTGAAGGLDGFHQGDSR